MRIKTFMAAFMLFLSVLFISFGAVSIYMSSSQLKILKEKSASEYQTIAVSLAKDISVLLNRDPGFAEEADLLADGYNRYYERNNVEIELTALSLSPQRGGLSDRAEMSFLNRGAESFIFVTGTLPEPFQRYRLDYYYNITKNMTELQNIQRTLLIICCAFSLITAFVLYAMLTKIFRPLDIVAEASKKIADGRYDQRIAVKGGGEISTVAGGFNRMAEEIEKQIRLLEEEADAKQRFVDNFAHEIRTPLTSVYGYAEYMLKTPLNEEEIIESAQLIIEEAGYMSKIAGSLLEVATLRQYKPVKNEISIPRLFENISQTLNKAISGHKCLLNCRYDAEILMGQEDLIKSLLLNLCSNAIKSCPPDGGVICLEARKQSERAVALSVTDNGCGIPEESLLKVTEPFYRVDKARSRSYGGAGLGLTLCRQIAEAHGAEMTIESAQGRGTTVKIIFTGS